MISIREFDRLLSPIQVGRINIRNRIVKAPLEPNTGLLNTLKGKVLEVYVAGAANENESCLIVDAIDEARAIGLYI